MADIAESAAFTDPATAISHGKRHLLVRDYTMAVTALAQACQLLVEKHGDTADELGEPYLLYGRALLGLAREEAAVLGGGVPGTEETEEDDEEDEEEAEDEKLSNIDEKEEEENEEHADNGATSEEKEKTEGKVEELEAEREPKKESEAEKKESEAEKKEEETVETSSEKKEVEKTDSNKTEDSKTAKQTVEKPEEDEKPAAGTSKDTSHANGPSCSTEQNGVVKENGENDSEDIEKEDEEDEVNNLQVAWEVLELAKLVLLKRGQAGWKLLADAYRLLGEVAMEGGNFQGALNDLHRCLELLQQIEPQEPRAIAEIHYQLALAHSLGNEFDASIEEFNKATELLEARIKELEEMKEPPKTDDSFYTVEGEIQELKELLPEIQEKISDMKDFKQEACKLVIEGIKSKVTGGCSNSAGPSGSNDSAPKVQKPASDISHLVRKKRKADELETEVASPCKKPTPEKTV
ncbi:nuclear autoantigenic sperm protein [Frieseomelitta varia]|uniref:nuclear autoantigenic sperm protein n=1 Tax=Frieseomelitta varia TaxID=561572 RepID=UPI001CB69AEC|nr:nuclear autoantigenic sperm protein [Frieseomelitta varia]XP_043522008.1 nuclear autoantigenic sperm protein [Frieseomelitta varia]